MMTRFFGRVPCKIGITCARIVTRLIYARNLTMPARFFPLPIQKLMWPVNPVTVPERTMLILPVPERGGAKTLISVWLT